MSLGSKSANKLVESVLSSKGKKDARAASAELGEENEKTTKGTYDQFVGFDRFRFTFYCDARVWIFWSCLFCLLGFLVSRFGLVLIGRKERG